MSTSPDDEEPSLLPLLLSRSNKHYEELRTGEEHIQRTFYSMLNPTGPLRKKL